VGRTLLGAPVESANGGDPETDYHAPNAETGRARRLEAILHPRIRERWLAQIENWRGENHPLVVVVIPLLFETNSQSLFDLTLCVAIVHHIDDGTLGRVVSELSRVTSGYLLLLEPLRNDARRVSRWLWHYDRGRHARTREELVAILGRSFHVDEAMEFAVYHQYLLCVARPVASVRGGR
jgi:hypothetical protein